MPQTDINFDDLFEKTITYPDPNIYERLNDLVGLDDYKNRLSKILGLLVNQTGIEKWAKQYHGKADKVLSFVLRRPPLVVLEGDVGSGKSELATTIGDLVARQEKIEITLLPLSLSTRGEGRVGQMTKLISSAFDFAFERAEKLKNKSGGARGAIILLVDEADALTQSRESSQMHHEDKAGVNAFIRGIDRIGNSRLPAAVIMCTNRLNTLDPAVKRRAADILKFSRPTDEQRYLVLKESFEELGLSEKSLNEVVALTGKNSTRDYGYTFSDLVQRFIPSVILDAYPENAVKEAAVLRIAKNMEPTPPFQDKP